MFDLLTLPETLLSDRVSLNGHITDNVVLTRSGSVLAMFDVYGVYPDTSDQADQARWFDVLHNAIKNIAAEDIEIYTYQCHGETDISGIGTAPHRSRFGRSLDEEYRRGLDKLTMWTNRLYLGIEIHPKGAIERKASATVDEGGTESEIEARRERLDEICDLLEAQLRRDFGLRRLGYVTRGKPGIIFDEIAEALVGAVTGVWRQIPATTGRMGNAMFSETIRFRRKRVEFHGPGDVSYGQMYGFREYPMSTYPGMFHSLAAAPYRNTIMQSFRILGNAPAGDVLTRKQNKAVTAGDKAVGQIAALSVAAEELLNREWVLGDHSLVVISFADDAHAMSEVGNATWRDLSGCGLVATRLTKALMAGFLSMLPGGATWRPRPGFQKSDNFVAYSPLYNWPAGHESGHWDGPPIAILRTLAGTPYMFHWHVNGVGCTLVTGMPGGGKTFATGFLIAMTAGRARVVALDHKRGWQFLFREMDGDYAVLGTSVPYFAPLRALANTEPDITFLLKLYRGCIKKNRTEEDDRRLNIGVRILMRLPPEKRHLSELCAFLGDEPEGAGVQLRKWCFGNELGWVLDAPEDKVRFNDLSGVDLTAVLDHPEACGPSLLYVFYRISLMCDGRPLMVPIDEGWKALKDPVFRPAIENVIRTIRSKNGVLVFISQHPSEIVESGIAHVLIDMCPTQMHFANPKGLPKHYVDSGMLNVGQYEALHEIQPGEGKFLLVRGQESVVVQLPMHGLSRFIPILSAREADLRAADEAIAEEDGRLLSVDPVEEAVA